MDEEENTNPTQAGYVWRILKSAESGSQIAFENILIMLAEDIRQTEKDEKFKNVMNTMYKNMLLSNQECVQLMDPAHFEALPGLMKTYEAAKEYNVGPLCIQLVRELGVGRVELNSMVDEIAMIASSQAARFVIVGLAAVYLAAEAFVSIYRWWNCEITGKRCAKNIIDSLGKTAAGISGGVLGVRLGLVYGPAGAILGSYKLKLKYFLWPKSLCNFLSNLLARIATLIDYISKSFKMKKLRSGKTRKCFST